MLDTESRHSSVLDQGPSRDPWLMNTMDWNLGTDQSLQDMLDCDIKSEIDSVIGGHPELGFNFTDLSPLELDDEHVGCNNDLHGWFGSQSYLNGNSNSSHSNFNLDLSGCDAASIMVNPNSVMPNVLSTRIPMPASTSSAAATARGQTPVKRHFAFSPRPDEVKNEDAQSTTARLGGTTAAADETELESDAERDYENDVSESEASEDDESDEDELGETQPGIKISLSSAGQKPKTLMLPASSIKTLSPMIKAQQQQQQTIKVNGISGGLRLQNVKILPSSPSQMQQLRRQIYNSNLQVVAQQQQQATVQQQLLQQASQLAQLNGAASTTPKSDKDLDPLGQEYDDKAYPKPAYSYSCLIAMALKNSQTGSLPVSEIYNFMCEHFPYFKTAPNGWKNSVRHNLSLNKCFEKIEKPAGNGNQRKGCLWAINPAKIAKMDEEVQKWSRKDPLAIKKAMIYPDHLELLERGEMKYVGSSCGDMSEETESSGDEVEGAEEADLLRHHRHSHSMSLGHVAAANSVTDSYDESSQDCDIDVNEQLYDEIDIDENKDALHMQLNISKQDSGSLSDYQLSPGNKRQKTLAGTLQANYVYQPVATARRKTPLFLAAGATTGSFLKIE